MKIKYTNYNIVFKEVPDETTLAINISNCPHKCEECHSDYLRQNIGKLLTPDELDTIIKYFYGITCICFMGGDANKKDINQLANYIKMNYPTLKVAWYSGDNTISSKIDIKNFDYIKIGEYNKEKGPLNSKTTNQIFYKVNHKWFKKPQLENITHLFYNDNKKF